MPSATRSPLQAASSPSTVGHATHPNRQCGRWGYRLNRHKGDAQCSRSAGGVAVRRSEYEGTSPLPAHGVKAPRLVVIEVINLQPCERESPWTRLPESVWIWPNVFT